MAGGVLAMTIKKRKCAACRRWFAPNPRVAHREFLYCPEPACRRQGKKESQTRWLEKNSGYYKGKARKAKVRRWAVGHPGYWQTWRRDHEDYRRREIERQRRGRALAVAKQDQIRQNPLGYLEGIRFLAAQNVAKQDQIGVCVEGVLDFLILREGVAKQEMMASAILAAP